VKHGGEHHDFWRESFARIGDYSYMQSKLWIETRRLRTLQSKASNFVCKYSTHFEYYTAERSSRVLEGILEWITTCHVLAQIYISSEIEARGDIGKSEEENSFEVNRAGHVRCCLPRCRPRQCSLKTAPAARCTLEHHPRRQFQAFFD
jgi:hypothetical protein